MEPNFKFYEIDEIIKLLQSKERLVYVDDGIEEAVIRYKDLPDFIVDYNEKCGLKDIKVYDYENPNMDKPLLDTFGVFLNKCEPKVREDIIYRLVMLQRGEIEVKDYKIIDEDTLDVANGTAPKMHTQLKVSIPQNGFKIKYKITATIQAKTEKMNCLKDSPKNILSLNSLISLFIFTSIYLASLFFFFSFCFSSLIICSTNISFLFSLMNSFSYPCFDCSRE